MAHIVPTVTASDRQTFQSQQEIVAFAPRVHLDFTDGTFAKPKRLDIELAYWEPDAQQTDIHLMLRDPRSKLETAIAKQPSLIILHVEADTFHDAFLTLEELQIPAGVALLPETKVGDAADYIARAQHVLIFGGKLGSQGGHADLAQLDKVSQIKAINDGIEIAWDGGANEQNITAMVDAGVDIINVGSAIHKARNAQEAYSSLQQLANQQ